MPRRQPDWPLAALALLVILLIVGVLAPHAWRRKGRPALPHGAPKIAESLPAAPGTAGRPTVFPEAVVEIEPATEAEAEAEESLQPIEPAEHVGREVQAPAEVASSETEQQTPNEQAPADVAAAPDSEPWQPPVAIVNVLRMPQAVTPTTTPAEGNKPEEPSWAMATDVPVAAPNQEAQWQPQADGVATPQLALVPRPIVRQSPSDLALAKDLIRQGHAPLPADARPPQASPPAIAQPPQVWKEPKRVLEALHELAKQKTTQSWANQALALVHELGRAMSDGSVQSPAILDKLEQQAKEAGLLANRLEDRSLGRKVRQTSYALSRRIDVWRPIASMDVSPVNEAVAQRASDERLSLCLAELSDLTRNSPEGAAWQRYLMLDALQEMTTRHESQRAVPREIAREVLDRLSREEMSPQQRQFINSRPVTALMVAMRKAAADPIDPADVLEHLERYEQTRSPTDAAVLAKDHQSLGLDDGDEVQQLGHGLETHYRNANLRIAVAESFMNRLLPKRDPESAPVRDTMLGVPVYGRSRTSTDVAVRMLPDPSRARMAFEVTGQIDSYTAANSGPATFYNSGVAYYIARKPLEVDMRGIRLEATDVQVVGDTHLQRLETDFDRIPVVNLLAKGIAERQHEQNKPAANREMRAKIAQKARDRVDAEVTAQLTQFAKRFYDRTLSPLYELELNPTMIDAETTADRVNMRLRLAGDDQLGGHTPRPQAPSTSLASVQVHESALNNALGRLELDGKTYTLPELMKHIKTKFKQIEGWELSPDSEDVKVTFAARDALNVHCQDGQVILSLAIAKLTKGRSAWRDFQVRALYTPQYEGRSAELVRDEAIHFNGPKLTPLSQIALRGVFSKIFSKKQPLQLMPDTLRNNANLKDVAVTQFAIDDGWLGLALGPAASQPKHRSALRPGILRR